MCSSDLQIDTWYSQTITPTNIDIPTLPRPVLRGFPDRDRVSAPAGGVPPAPVAQWPGTIASRTVTSTNPVGYIAAKSPNITIAPNPAVGQTRVSIVFTGDSPYTDMTASDRLLAGKNNPIP